jgi:hypothetical protein
VNSYASLVKNPGQMVKAQKFLRSVQQNLQILEQYRKFPLQLYKYLHALDFYINQIICIINKYIDMII